MRNVLATLALAPVLLAQGQRVRRTMIKLPEAEGPRQGRCGNGPRLRLLIAGDSAAAGVGVATQKEALAGYLLANLKSRFRIEWQVVARSGATTLQTIDTLEALPAQKFDVVLTSLGVNDLVTRKSLDQWRKDQQRLIALFDHRFQAGQILLSSLPPIHRFPSLPEPLRWYMGDRAQQFNAVLHQLSRQHPAIDIVSPAVRSIGRHNLASDGFHPGAPIYEHWAAVGAHLILARAGHAQKRRRRRR